VLNLDGDTPLDERNHGAEECWTAWTARTAGDRRVGFRPEDPLTTADPASDDGTIEKMVEYKDATPESAKSICATRG
jgi:hypothetical protein